MREALRKAEQKLAGCSGKAIDRLPRVPHHAKFITFTKPGLQKRLLQRRNVLILIDRKEAKLLLHVTQHASLIPKHARGEQDRILPVNYSLLLLEQLVGLKKLDKPFGIQRKLWPLQTWIVRNLEHGVAQEFDL